MTLIQKIQSINFVSVMNAFLTGNKPKMIWPEHRWSGDIRRSTKMTEVAFFSIFITCYFVPKQTFSGLESQISPWLEHLDINV